MFLLSLMLVVVTAWSVGTFLRLNSASKKYNNNKDFESACQLSNEYVKAGVWMGIAILLISVVVFAMSSYNVYRNYKE